MADPPSYPGTGDTREDTRTRPAGGTARPPRWKAAAVWAVVIAVLLVMLILHLTGTFGPGSNG
jgi:hypothetical protein